MKTLYKIVWFKKENIGNLERCGVDPNNYAEWINCDGGNVYTIREEAMARLLEWNTIQSVWKYSLLAVPYEGEL